MQCKDIPDEVFLDAVRTAGRLLGTRAAFSWSVSCVLAGHPEHLEQLPAAGGHVLGYQCFPWRLIRAKAAKLIGAERMDGCPCGCRGDFVALPPAVERETPVQRLVRITGV